MAIFDSILFEGQQADEYKARKEKEKADKEAAEEKRRSRRHDSSFKDPNTAGHKKLYSHYSKSEDSRYKGDGDVKRHVFESDEDKERASKARDIVSKDFKYKSDKSGEYLDKAEKTTGRESSENFDKGWDWYKKQSNAYMYSGEAEDKVNKALRKNPNRFDKQNKNESCGIFESVQMI